MLARASRPEPRPEPQPVRAGRALRVLTGLAIAITLAAVVLRFAVAPLDRFDEGITLLRAMLLSQGALPYRDFWTSYGPFDSLLLAGLFHVFGLQVLIERMMAAALGIGFAAVGWRLCGGIGLRGPLRFSMTGLLALVAVSVPAVTATVVVDLLGLIAFAAFFRSIETRSRPLALAAGVTTGVASFARPEFALALAAGLLTGHVILLLRRQPGAGRRLALYALGALLTAVLLWTPIVVAAGLPVVAFNLVVHTLAIYPAGRRIPLGQGPDGPAVLALAACFVGIWCWGGVRAVRGRTDPPELARLTAVLVSAVIAFDWVLTRADAPHAIGAWPLTALLLALLLQRRTGSMPPARHAALISLISVCLFMGAVLALAGRDLARPAESDAVPHAAIVGSRAWMPASQLAALVGKIDAAVPPGEPIFVGLQRNDLVVFNDAMLYFLSGRHPGTRYDEYIPALTTDARIQELMTCQLARSNTTLAVLGPNTAGEPQNASSKPGSTILDSWLRAHTVGRTDFPPYVVLRLRIEPSDRAC